MAAVNPFSEQKKSEDYAASANTFQNDEGAAFVGTNLLDLAGYVHV